MMLEISRSVLDAIGVEAAASPEHEVCGLLFGPPNRIAAAAPSRNVAVHPADSFEIDPAQLIAAYRAERGGGARIAGCYHSHPSGSADPSLRDAEQAVANGWVWLIVGSADIRAYQSVRNGAIHGRFDALALDIR